MEELKYIKQSATSILKNRLTRPQANQTDRPRAEALKSRLAAITKHNRSLNAKREANARNSCAQIERASLNGGKLNNSKRSLKYNGKEVSRQFIALPKGRPSEPKTYACSSVASKPLMT
jgi:hypothetical protein